MGQKIHCAVVSNDESLHFAPIGQEALKTRQTQWFIVMKESRCYSLMLSTPILKESD
jgi:hypothetical protein